MPYRCTTPEKKSRSRPPYLHASGRKRGVVETGLLACFGRWCFALLLGLIVLGLDSPLCPW